MRRRLLASLLLLVGHARAYGKACFDVLHDDNTDATNRTFVARGCQGGGVTWAALLDGAIHRRGAIPAHDAGRSWAGQVYRVAGALTSIDEEGDAVRVCSSNKVLTSWLRSEYRRLNHDAAALGKAVDAADPKDTECFGKAR